MKTTLTKIFEVLYLATGKLDRIIELLETKEKSTRSLPEPPDCLSCRWEELKSNIEPCNSCYNLAKWEPKQ